MVPSNEQIKQAAFGLWMRRGRPHGFDREDWFAAERELTFSVNYETIAEYPLDAPGTLVLGDRRACWCRFCERTEVSLTFGPPKPLLAGRRARSLLTAAVCGLCQASFRDGQAALLERFQAGLAADSRRSGRGQGPSGLERYSPAVFKALVGCALSIMPESELGYFVDALEWVSNPDAERDESLFAADGTCLVYKAPFLADRSWTSIARRIDKGAPVPYMIYFLAESGVLLQIQIPLCIRDQDLDGRAVIVPTRSFVAGEGETFEQAHAREFRLERGRAR